MKIETHCHTKGGSNCADGDNDKLVNAYVKNGYDGIVITNHVSKYNYFNVHKGDTHREKTRYFYSLIEQMSERLKAVGIKCFFGAEIRILPLEGRPCGEEFMVYGITEKMMADNKPFFNYTQKELFEFADKNGLFMYQTHPFRDGVTAGDPRYLHGAEAFNGHYHHDNHNDLSDKFCEENRLIKMAGTDYHHDGQPITAGITTARDINTEDQLIDCIMHGEFSLVKDETAYLKSLKEYKGS